MDNHDCADPRIIKGRQLLNKFSKYTAVMSIVEWILILTRGVAGFDRDRVLTPLTGTGFINSTNSELILFVRYEITGCE